MRIAIIGAAGKAGSLIRTEAAHRGIEVTGFGRSAKPGVDVVKDVYDITAEDLSGFDAVVDALSFPNPGTYDGHIRSLAHITKTMAGSPARLLVVGGAGSLFVNPEHTTQLRETPGFPEAFVPMATAQATQLADLRKVTDVKWTYISPAAMFVADGERTGSYVLAGEEFTTGADGNSTISYADYAIAMVDEVEKAAHVGERISVHAA